MNKKPTIDDLLDEIENMVQCFYYDQITEEDWGAEAADFVIAAFKELCPERYEGAIERAKAEIIEEGLGHLLEDGEDCEEDDD